jgi:glycosyltransferase involved in cell wall biosynthesis
VFPAGSVEDLTAAMEDCLARPVEHLQALGAAGFERVLERHSIDTEAGKLAEFLRAATGTG